jgi:hypothetical protein
MERRIPKITAVLLFTFVATSFVFAQEASQKEQLRIQLWAELDAYPGLVANGSTDFTDAGESGQASEAAAATESSIPQDIFGFAISRMEAIAPFIMGGMIHGWTFDYTPSDKVRAVEEYFACVPAMPFDKKVNPIEYRQVQVLDDKLYGWAYCNRTPTQQASFDAWGSVTHPKIHGVGQGPVAEGFDGIKTAFENAVKSAVREYWRTQIKNKPKEITGTVLLIHNPRIYIKEGRYTVDLDFFMETGRIIPYSYY